MRPRAVNAITVNAMHSISALEETLVMVELVESQPGIKRVLNNLSKLTIQMIFQIFISLKFKYKIVPFFRCVKIIFP